MNRHIFTIGFIAISGIISAQQLPLGNQYLINKFSLSPAYTGHNNNFETFVSVRKNWTGVDGAPETRVIDINGPLLQKMGLGGTLISDRIGIFRTFSASLSYAYHLRIDQMQMLRFGLAAGVLENFIDISDIENQQTQLDPVVAGNQSVEGLTFDASASIAYSYDRLHLALVVPQLIPTKINNNNNDTTGALYTLSRHYLAGLFYSFNINREWQVEPYAVVRKTGSSPVFFDFAALFKFQKKIWLGLNYRKGSSFGVTVGGLIYNRIALNYSYEFATNGIMGESGGSHEVSLGFLLGNEKNTMTSIFNQEVISKKKPYFQWAAE